MKKTLLTSIFTISILILNITYINISAEEDNTNNELIDIINSKNEEESEAIKDFKLHKFNSCEDMNSVMSKYLEKYYSNNRYNSGPIYLEDNIDISIDMAFEEKSIRSDSISMADGVGGGGNPDNFSETNTQIKGVDESDIIKTDGKYSYYFSNEDRVIYINKIFPVSDLKTIKKIKIPKDLYSPVLYLDQGKLTIIAGLSRENKTKRIWEQKTGVAVYDVSDLDNVSLDKYYEIDGNVRDSRRIGDYVYIISNKQPSFPRYYSNQKDSDDLIDEALESFSSPKKIEIRKTGDSSEQNLSHNGKSYPYNISVDTATDCNNISYILPESDEVNSFPTFTIVSVLNLTDSKAPTTTQVIFGNTDTVFMSKDNLYLTSNIYLNTPYSCPFNARCIMPMFDSGSNTVVHKLSLDRDDIEYKNSKLIPGSPLTQYSMNENSEGGFEILTQIRGEETHVNFYILDNDLEDIEGSITKIAPNEEFKSSRYIGDKLYLVTFERTDPLFVIDTEDKSNPEIIGELKIPGYSTYLHPLDDNHLIGLGYDTYENEWGGINNGGVKVDLYKVDYSKKDKDGNISITQDDSFVIGDKGSYSEALHNPRMFVWYAEKNILLLPIQANYHLSKNTYNLISVFQGFVSLKITPENGIENQATVTHITSDEINKDREKMCIKYNLDNPKVGDCIKTIDGKTICYEEEDLDILEERYYETPKYCEKDPEGDYLVSEDKYFASNFYNYYTKYINRVLYADDIVYSFSNKKLQANEIGGDYDYLNSVELD